MACRAPGLESDFNNVAPRVGMSWDVTGDGKLLVRGGYGIFYDSGTLIENSALYFNPPYWTLQLFVPTPRSLVTLDAPFPSGKNVLPRPSINTMNPNFRTGYAQEATVGVERVFGTVTTAARYVTSYGNDLVRKRNINQPVPGPGSLDSRRPINGFGDILVVESTASSTYHALELSAQRPSSPRAVLPRRLHAVEVPMDDTSAFLATDGDDNTPQDSRNLAAEWGPSDYDVRQRLVAVGEVRGAVESRAAGCGTGRRAASSPRSRAGRSRRASASTTATRATSAAARSPTIARTWSPTPATDGALRQLRGQLFAIAPHYTFGNAGRNSLTGPWYVTLDGDDREAVALSRRTSVQLRLEVFNLFNRSNYQLPDTFVDHVTFGQSLAAYPPRQLQLAARFAF